MFNGYLDGFSNFFNGFSFFCLPLKGSLGDLGGFSLGFPRIFRLRLKGFSFFPHVLFGL